VARHPQRGHRVVVDLVDLRALFEQQPQNVEVTLKMAGSTLARQVVPIVNSELKKQLNQNR
jgi:hypothetical protein